MAPTRRPRQDGSSLPFPRPLSASALAGHSGPCLPLGRAVEPVGDGLDSATQFGRFQHGELDAGDARVRGDVIEGVGPGDEYALVGASCLKDACARREVLRGFLGAGVQPDLGAAGVLRCRHGRRDESGGIGQVAAEPGRGVLGVGDPVDPEDPPGGTVQVVGHQVPVAAAMHQAVRSTDRVLRRAW